MSDSIVSSPSVPMNELPACCIAAFKKGQKVITYRCDGCSTLRQFETDRTCGYRSLDIGCDCGHQQAVHVF